MRHDQLPPWFERPDTHGGMQAELFPVPLGVLMDELGVDNSALDRLCSKGWIEPVLHDEVLLQPWQEAELRVVAALAWAGWDEARITTMLAELPRPFSSCGDRLTYSLHYGWCSLSRLPFHCIGPESSLKLGTCRPRRKAASTSWIMSDACCTTKAVGHASVDARLRPKKKRVSQ